MIFEVDSCIHGSCICLGDWALSRVYFKKDANFPWAILVPREENTQEIYQLSQEKQQILVAEIAALSKIMDNYFKPDKLNVGALGNLVSQLHIHVVARFKKDKAWPHGIWQPNLAPSTYPNELLEGIIQALRERLNDFSI